MAAFTTAEIVTGLETLPQELYDKIFNLTFARKVDHRFIIDAQYKPPIQLQIDRATRKEFTNRYYGAKRRWRAQADRGDRRIGLDHTTTEILHDHELKPASHLLKAWLRSLPKDALHAVVHGATGKWGTDTRRTRFKASWDDSEMYVVRWRTYGVNLGNDGHNEVVEIVEILASE